MFGSTKVEPWNYNTKNNISFSVSQNSSMYLMVPIDFTNDQNNMRRVIWRNIYTLKIKIRIKDTLET